MPLEDSREAAAVRVLAAVAAVMLRALTPAETDTPAVRALRALAGTTDGGDTWEAPAIMAAMSPHVCTGGLSIADLTVEAFIPAMAILMATLMIPVTPTALAMLTIPVILTVRRLLRRPAPRARTISVAPGSLAPTAIPAKANIRLRNRTTIPISSSMRSRSRTTIRISLNGTIDNCTVSLANLVLRRDIGERRTARVCAG